MKEITVHELDCMRKNNEPHFLLDVREDDELAIAMLEGAFQIPMDEIAVRSNELPNDKPIIVMCRSGRRSAMIVSRLAYLGFDALNLKGGILEWSRAIDPSLDTY